MSLVKVEKPSYEIQSLEEIREYPWNGYKVVSTFTGAGGSCLGFKMAGFKAIYANEFVPAARETYKKNFPGVPVDDSDIRDVSARDILEATGLKARQVDVLEGSPPCASFSMAGKREKGWSKIKQYSDTKQRTDDLFFEYARLVDGIRPKVFVAENVAGLVRGKAKGYFKEILSALKHCGYLVQARVLDAQWLGVPQARQRVIFIGVRNDLVQGYGVEPRFPKPFTYRYTLRDALPHVIKHGDNGGFGRGGLVDSSTKPSGTIGASPNTGNGKYPPSLVEVDITAASATHPTERRKFTIEELKRICSFPGDFVLTGTYAQRWERLGRSVPPLMMRAIAEVVRDEILQKIHD